MAVPTVFLNGEVFDQGRMSLEQIVAKLDTGACRSCRGRDRRPGSLRRPRRRRRTRRRLRRHLRGAQGHRHRRRRRALRWPGARHDGDRELHLRSLHRGPEAGRRARAARQGVRRRPDGPAAGDAAGPGGRARRPGDGRPRERRHRCRARTVVLSTGARWRPMGVPGEAEYRNKGVTYCPHCDGPLFKGKRVAVIGGGNSGVEAAIDLAGVVSPRHADRVRRSSARRRGAAAQAAQPPERRRRPQRAAPPRWWATATRSPASATTTGPTASTREVDARRRLRADRPAAQHRVARGRGRADRREARS